MSANLCRALRDPNMAMLLGEEAANVIESLRSTLQFYAQNEHYTTKMSNLDRCVLADRGEQARQVLQSIAKLDAAIVLPVNGHHVPM